MTPATSPGVLPAIPGYRLWDQIGRGGFGVVYAGEAEGGQPVALKVLHRVLDDDARRRFDREIQIMGTLGWHPNIVRILDAGAVEGQPFIVMEHLPDGSLGARLRAEGAQPWATVLRHGVDAATALQVAHNAGLLHRDIKPDNLLRTSDGVVKLSDFGVTVAAGDGDGERGATGTLAYSAPELLGGASPSPASDIYALGATMFALLSGDPAFHRTTDESPAAMVLRAFRDPLPDLRPTGTPESVVRVVERAMAKDPAARPATAADLVKELRGAAAAESVALPAPAPTGQQIPAAAVAAPAQAPPGRPAPAAGARAQRLQKVAGGLTAVAALVIAVSVVTVSDFGRPSGDDAGEAPPPAVAPADPDAAADEENDQAPADEAAPPAASEAPPPASPAPAAPADPAPDEPPLVANPPSGGPAPVVLASTPIGGAGDDRRSVVATATTLEVHSLDGTRLATTSVRGIRELAIAGDVIAAVAGEDVGFFDADSLALLGGTVVPGVGEITGAGGSFWAATTTGLVAITTDGEVLQQRGFRTSLSEVATAGDVVWTATAAGDLTAVSSRDGRVLGTIGMDDPVAELAGLPDGSAVVVVDGTLQRIGLDGTVRVIDVPGTVVDVAATDGGSVYVLTREGLLRLDDDGATPVSTSDVKALWPAGATVSAAVDRPPMVERYG